MTVLNPGDKQSELGAVREIVSKLSPPVSPDTSPHRNEMSRENVTQAGLPESRSHKLLTD